MLEDAITAATVMLLIGVWHIYAFHEVQKSTPKEHRLGKATAVLSALGGMTAIILCADMVALSLMSGGDAPGAERALIDGAEHQMWFLLIMVSFAIIGFHFLLSRLTRRGEIQKARTVIHHAFLSMAILFFSGLVPILLMRSVLG